MMGKKLRMNEILSEVVYVGISDTVTKRNQLAEWTLRLLTNLMLQVFLHNQRSRLQYSLG